MPVVVLLADGTRPDTLAAAMDAGQLPALARLREEGAMHTVTTCFPSVTGPAYAPFLVGRHPGSVGLPALRWYDRARTTCRAPDYARSYVGYQMGMIDADLDADAPTIFELCPGSLGSMSVIGRGLARGDRLGSITPRSALRAARTHFRGDLEGWMRIDREAADTVISRVRRDRPPFVFAALMGVDKGSHAAGHGSLLVRQALGIVNDTAAQIREDAERSGHWRDLHLWVVSDHGHSRVRQHDELSQAVRELGFRVMAHPWVFGRAPEVAVMVSGNAMAHLYVELGERRRPRWPLTSSRWGELVEQLLIRPSVDLVLLPRTGHRVEVRARGRGTAVVTHEAGRYGYERVDGDPLGLGRDLASLDETSAHEATMASDYPDALVQIIRLASAPRSGDIILSAARDWDFRRKYEPIPHVSSHGALHREHMLVPLLLSQPASSQPHRTVDVMPSALAALGVAIPAGVEGHSFL